MKRRTIKKMAGFLAALMLMNVPSALAVEAAAAGTPAPQPPPASDNVAIVEVANENSSKVNLQIEGKKEIKAGEQVSFFATIEEGFALDRIAVNVTKVGDQVPPAEASIRLDKTSTSGTDKNNYITAAVDVWPSMANTFKITVTAGDLRGESRKVTLAASVEGKTHRVEIAENYNAKLNGAGDYGNGKKVTLSVIPHDRYELKSLALEYTLGDKVETTTITGATTWQGLKITWNPTAETTIVGNLYGALKVTPTVEKVQVTYKVRVYGGDGIRLEHPANEITTVNEGESLSVRVKCEEGYLIDQMMMQVGKAYTNWTPGQSYFMVNYDRVQVRESPGSVSFIIPEITDDITVEFNTTYDQENIPVRTEEGTNIHINTDVGDTVARGTDATFTISSTSYRHSVKKITVQVGDSKATANPGSEYIRVGKRNYEMQDNGNGTYSLYIDNIREPVTVSAESSGSDAVSRPRLTINSSSNMNITKSVSGNTIYEGDSVRFYFTPYRNYQIEEITLKIGRESRTVSANNSFIQVDGRSYPMQRDASGMITLYLDYVDQNVTVSGRAYYSRDPVQPTSALRLDKSSRVAFLNGFTDGTFRPETKMTRAEAVVMLRRLCNAVGSTNLSSGFYDVPSNMWCAREISEFVAAGIVDSGTYFYPNQNISRGDFVEMLYRLEGSPSTSYVTQRFRDVSGTPREKAIYYAVSRGWINGYSDGTFRPYGAIDRSEIAALMTRVIGRTTGGNTVSYRDVPSNHWAYRYIQLASAYV